MLRLVRGLLGNYHNHTLFYKVCSSRFKSKMEKERLNEIEIRDRNRSGALVHNPALLFIYFFLSILYVLLECRVLSVESLRLCLAFLSGLFPKLIRVLNFMLFGLYFLSLSLFPFLIQHPSTIFALQLLIFLLGVFSQLALVARKNSCTRILFSYLDFELKRCRNRSSINHPGQGKKQGGYNILFQSLAFNMKSSNSDVHRCWAFGLFLMLTVSFSGGFTDPRDVSAINSLHAALGSPSLPGWLPIGGDPCTDAWQGVLCVNSNITGISLNGANLGGELGTNLNMFASIISIDLSDNHIGGTIPSNLPPTMKTFFLSANQFTGGLPVGLSSLSQLTDFSVNANNLSGPIPDVFQQLTGLINLDLSGNNLTGPLPPSMGNLTALSTLHLQENTLAGTLNVLQDLPLIDLDIENNQFSGPIPPKLLSIPTFRSTGNPFNTTVLPSPPASSPALSPNSSMPGEPSPHETPKQQIIISPTSPETKSSNRSLTTKKTLLSALVVVFILAIIGFGLWLCITRFCKKRKLDDKLVDGHEKSAPEGVFGKTKDTESRPQAYRPTSEEAGVKPQDAREVYHPMDVKGLVTVPRIKNSHAIDMTGPNVGQNTSLAKPPSQQASVEKVIVKPINPADLTMIKQPQAKMSCPSSLRPFTVAMLQQYTDSFSQVNLIGEGTLGTVYRAELPDGKLAAVKKLNSNSSGELTDGDFLQLVSNLSELQHPNIVKLIGYCVEYGQRLLVYEYCTNGTVFDALHFDDEIHKKLSWNARIRIALGAAKALEFLHEIRQPPVVHKNFSSVNILLDDQMVPHVSECGLAPLLLDSCPSGDSAPELETGSYTRESDVFSYGVVMLELLTGRRSYDRSRPRGEQFLVRWAVHHLHDIDALSKMVDPSLNGAYPSKSLSRFADIISLCVQAEPEFRPPISEIVQSLLKMAENTS